MDLIFSGTILWEIFHSDIEILKSFDTSMEQFSLRKSELMETLRKIHSRGVTILWMLLDPMRVIIVSITLCFQSLIKGNDVIKVLYFRTLSSIVTEAPY